MVTHKTRLFLAVSLFGICALAVAHGQARPADDRLIGTWTGPMHCLHGDGPLPDTFTMSIARDANGKVTGAMDWGLATSDGRKGPLVPFTTLTVDGSTIVATATMDANATPGGNQTARLEATVENGTITGTWRVQNVDDVWTFTGKKQ